MPTPYIYERQAEYWTSRGIEEFFLDNGFDVLVFPLTQPTERDVPNDFMFRDQGTKKLSDCNSSPYTSKNGEDAWNISETQHERLQQFDWMYYGLSDLTSGSQQRTALHCLRIKRVDFPISLTSLGRTSRGSARAAYTSAGRRSARD